MTVAIVGAGAIGALLGGHLSAASDGVVLVDEWTEHVKAINAHGLELGGVRGERRFSSRAMTFERFRAEVPAASLIFLCVKSQDSERAAQLFAPAVAPDTAVISVQNGMGHELLAAHFGSERVLAGVCEVGGYLERPGRVVETRAAGGFVVGELDGRRSPRARAIARLMGECAPTTVSDNVVGLRWSKLLWNCMMNPVSALTGLGQGEIVLDARMRRLLLDVGAEGVAVALAAGARLDPLHNMGIDPRRFAASGAEREELEGSLVDRYSSQLGKTTSMAQDIVRGRPTEIQFLNGYLVTRGRELGVATPLNAELVRLVSRLERGTVEPGPSAVEPLLAVESRQ